MPGRGFLELARDVVTGNTEFHWRGTAVHAYYGLLLEARDALFRWGFQIPRRENVHTWVRLRFAYASAPDLKQIGLALDRLVRLRNQASYDLTPSIVFLSPQKAQQTIKEATQNLALLDAIDNDPPGGGDRVDPSLTMPRHDPQASEPPGNAATVKSSPNWASFGQAVCSMLGDFRVLSLVRLLNALLKEGRPFPAASPQAAI